MEFIKKSLINLSESQIKAACVYLANIAALIGISALKDFIACLVGIGTFSYTMFNLYVNYRKFKDKNKKQ